MLVQAVCRTTVGLSAASAAVPNGQDDDRRGSGEGPLGRLAGSVGVLARLEWPRGYAWIAVAPPRVDASVYGGNNPPSRHAVVDRRSVTPIVDTLQATSTVTPDGSTGSGSTVKPTRSGVDGSVPSTVSARTVGPAPEITAGTPADRSASTSAADSG